MSISIDTLKEAISIKEQIASLEARLNKLLGGGGDGPFPLLKSIKKGRRKMSASARAKIAAAQRARWAKQKGTSVIGKPAKKKGGITAEGRKRLAAVMKARWAARKKGAPALNARKK